VIWPGLAPATPEILMVPRTEMASTALTTRRRQPGAIRTLDLNLRYPAAGLRRPSAGTFAAWCDRHRSGRLHHHRSWLP
jgi:hypothetical protein